jgi:phosphoglucosamine mutase
MLRHGYTLGGEQSGHIIFAEHNTTGDGIVTALQVLATMVRSGKALSELAAVMRRFPQVLRNVRVARKEDLATLPAVQREIQNAEAALANCGRVLVRFSGTEPLVRVMVEGPDEGKLRTLAESIVGAVEAALG